MIPSQSLGPYRLRALLAEDAYGSLHRAVRVEGGTFGRHAMVRRFDEAWTSAGLSARLGEAVALSLKVGEQPGLAPHLRIYSGSEAFLAYDLVPGRSLAESLAACRAQGMPFALEHIFTVMRDLGDALAALHAKGLEGTLLDPDLTWLGFDGSVLLLDAPVAPLLQELAGRRPALATRLHEAGLPLDPLQRDLARLARLGFAMLALDPTPHPPEAMVQGIRGWAAGEGRAAEGLVALFRRMTGLGEPFRDLLEFQFAAGQLLQAEDHAPSTFSLAFLMQTVFRMEIREEERAMALEREQVWTLSGPVPALAAEPEARPSASGRGFVRALVGAGLVAAVGGGYLLVHRQNREAAEGLRAELVAMQRREAEFEQRKAELDSATQHEAQARHRLEQELKAAESLARQEVLRQQLEAARLRENELARMRAQVQAERQAQLERKAQAERAALPEKRVEAKAAAILPPPPPPPPALLPIATPVSAPPSTDQPAKALRLPALSGHGQAKVRVRVFVSEQGRPLRALVLDAPAGRGLEEPAKEAALQGIYQPALQGGQPIRAWIEVELSAK